MLEVNITCKLESCFYDFVFLELCCRGIIVNVYQNLPYWWCLNGICQNSCVGSKDCPVTVQIP